MYFLGSLGIDIGLLIAQLVNFVILLFVLTKFVYKPLLRRIEADEAAIAESERARALVEQKEKQLAAKEKRYLTKTKNEARAVIEEAEEIAKSIREEAQLEMQHEKEAVIAQINQRLAEVNAHEPR
ncbi:hypothetical protein KC906_00755 [Candidatus Kaiserbacteria bacterium]|nr:hypothetical protein [Candidatus Kaiserbacteria bacterium]